MQAELIMQLETERRKVKELQQYESMYREWRVRANSSTSELAQLRRSLSDKDGELATAYERCVFLFCFLFFSTRTTSW